MLLQSPEFKPAMIDAHLEPCMRIVKVESETGSFTDLQEERFKFIVDETDTSLATITDQYKLVTNAEFVDAVDRAASELGIRVEPLGAHYVNGRSYFRMQLPDLTMKVGDDPSPTTCTIDLQNDYRGSGSIKVLAGWFRLVCTNGLVVGEIASRETRRHVGDFDIYEWVKPAMEKVWKRFEKEQRIAAGLAEERFDAVEAGNWRQGREAAQKAIKADDGGTLIDRILADTADRYHDDLRVAARDYQFEIGGNLWALAQAVSDVATHRMQKRANGDDRTNFNAAADEWATRQYNRIVAYAAA